MACDLADELFELAVVSGPLFDFGNPFHRHIERARAAPHFEGQMPAWLGAAGPFERREAAFGEGAQASDLALGRLARAGVPVRNDCAGVHIEWNGSLALGASAAGLGYGLIPGGVLEGLAEQLADLLFQGVIVANALFAFAGLRPGEGFGGALGLDEAGPAVIGTVELGRFCFAGAVGFAAGALGGGEAAGEHRESDVEDELFCLHLS